MENESNEINTEQNLTKLKSEDTIKLKDEYYKTNSKIINNLLVDYFTPDSNQNVKSENNLIKVEKNQNPEILKKQKLFSNQKYYTKKELKTKINNICKTKKRASIHNFLQKRTILQNQFNQIGQTFTIRDLKINKNKKRYIEYDDLYFEDDMFIPESSSFPNEKEEDFLLKLQFIEENDYNENIEDHSIRYGSINYKKNQRDQMHSKYFNNSNKELSDKKLYEFDNVYKEEKEEEEKNIFYIDNSKSNNNIKVIKNNDNNIKMNEMNEKTISFISLNLLIKKVTLENFRNKYSFIYKCFLEQFKYFININNLVNKIFSAFNYYYEVMKIDTTELLLFLNTLIYENFDIIKEDKTTLNKLGKFYTKINEIKWENQEIIQDLKSINFLLFKYLPNVEKKEDLDEIINSITISEPKNDNNFKTVDKNKEKSKDNKKNNIIKGKDKKVRYFYVLNFKPEEIAQYLTYESYQMLSDIPESELYNKNYARKDKDIKAPHIKKIFDRYEKLTYFIIEDICSYDHLSDRVDVIEKWIKIAFVCNDLKNFNDLIMLNTLFCHYLLKKSLKNTWAKLSKKTLNYLDKMNKICSGNQCYKKIRNEIFKCKCPYVPYIGILLKELTYIEEKKYIINNSNINIKKLTELNKTITKFFEFKKYKYSFDKSKNLEILSNADPKSADEIEGIIKQLEPKLVIHAQKGDKKRLTKTDKLFYASS